MQFREETKEKRKGIFLNYLRSYLQSCCFSYDMLIIENLKSRKYTLKIILPISSPPEVTAINFGRHFFVVVFFGSVNPEHTISKNF